MLRKQIGIIALLFSFALAKGQAAVVSDEEEEIKAAWKRVVEELGGEWEFPLYLILYTEGLDLEKPDIRPAGKEEQWTTIIDGKAEHRYLSYVSNHDGKGGEEWIRFNSDGTEDGRGKSYFDANGAYRSDYGTFETVKVFNDAGWLVEEKDLDETFPAQLRYSYEGAKLIRIESRDPDEVQVEELSYDDKGRLATVLTHLGDGNEVMKRIFTYDERDRLIGTKRLQEGVTLAWDRHTFSEDGKKETIQHQWIHRKTGNQGGRDITTREFDNGGTLRREVRESFEPEDPGNPQERTEEEYDESGFLIRRVMIENGGPQRVETFERKWTES